MALQRPLQSKYTVRLRKAERKQQLLHHAKQLFVTLGYQHSTTEKIAQAAGVTEPVLYRHFPSKKALFLEVLKQIREATLYRWHAEIDRVDNPLDQLRVIIDLYLGSTRDHAIELHIMHRTLLECDDLEIAAALRQFYLDNEDLLADIIDRGKRENVFRADVEPRVAAWELIRTALGYSLTVPLDIPLYEEGDYHQRAVNFVLAGLR